MHFGIASIRRCIGCSNRQPAPCPHLPATVSNQHFSGGNRWRPQPPPSHYSPMCIGYLPAHSAHQLPYSCESRATTLPEPLGSLSFWTSQPAIHNNKPKQTIFATSSTSQPLLRPTPVTFVQPSKQQPICSRHLHRKRNNKSKQSSSSVQYDEHSRSKWLHRSTFLQCPAIEHDGHTLQTDQAVLRAIHTHWTELWQAAHATPAVQKTNNTINNNLPSHPSLQDRPSPDEFAQARKRLKGAAGPDGWIAEELQWLPAPVDEWFCNISHIWEQAGRIPTSLQFSRQINLIKPAKVHNGTTAPKDLRPINVYSLFYRWWSSTWSLPGVPRRSLLALSVAQAALEQKNWLLNLLTPSVQKATLPAWITRWPSIMCCPKLSPLL